MPSDSEEEIEDVDFDLDEDAEPDLEDEGLLDGIEVADDATEDGDDVWTRPYHFSSRICVSHITLRTLGLMTLTKEATTTTKKYPNRPWTQHCWTWN